MKHFNRSWSELAAGGGRYYMKPQCVQQQKQTEQDDHSNNGPSGCERSGGYTGCIALYMPYLTIGSYDPGAPERRTTVFKATGNPGNSRNSKQIKHAPMTLDQYYYPTISNTSERDNDQVLSKFLQKKHEQPSKAEKKILMVNHLWVWIIDEKTIITATTDASNQESSEGLDQKTNGRLLEDALRNILRNENGSIFEGATSAYSVMELILGVATGLFVEKSVTIPKQSSKGPVEIFRDSIRDVANREASLFKDFLYGLQEARRQQGPLPEQQLDHKSQSRPAPLSRYHVISSETELLYEIRDIRDELHILRSLAEDQEVVWQQAFPSNRMKNESSRFEFCTPTDVKKDLDVMLLEADKIEGYINTLLDLRQAEYGRLQAYDSARLSKILFVFTVATIVFLPLSFLSSLFALDVSVFPHEAGNLKYQGWWLFPILFGVTTIVSVPTIALAWNVNAISAKLSPQKKVEYDDTTPHRNEPTRWGKLRRRLRGKGDNNGKNDNGIPLHETI
ncbi:hypothetical protein F5B21DRAFT_50144 [Xylaria acuta]|nr:hypothetical protein F5B21DRAFT_50144 [Xylaria acuta]